MSALRPAVVFSAAVLLFAAVPQLRAGHPDLTGSWVLDTGASTFSSAPPTSGTLTIRKHGKKLFIKESFALPNGEKSREFEWRVDDEFHPVGPGMGEVIARWDHDALVGERRTGEGQNMETVRMTQRDPNSMMETVVRPDSQSALVWRRQ